MLEFFKLKGLPGFHASEEVTQLFRTLLLTICIVIIVFASVDILAGGDPRGEIVNGIILIVTLITAGILSTGCQGLAFMTFGWGAWSAITVQVVLTGDLGNTTFFFYPVVILMSGWLLGLRQGYLICLASIASILGVAWLESSGIRFFQIHRGPWARAADMSVILLLSMMVLQRVLVYQQDQTTKLAQLNTKLTQTVTHLTAREHALSHAESLFSKIGDVIPAPLSLTDSATGEVIFLNKAWENILGWKQQDAIGKSASELGFWVDTQERNAFGAEFRRQGCVRNLDIHVRARNGTVFPVSASADSVEQNGRGLTMTALFDLTQIKLIEAKVLKLNAELEARVEQRTLELKAVNEHLSGALSTLRHAQKELVQSEKLAALGSLVAGVSHELNTPIGNALVVISSMYDRAREFERLIRRNELKRSSLERFVADSLEGTELAQRSLQRASDLVYSFKQVAVDQSSERQRVFGLAGMVREIVATLKPNLKNLPWTIEFEIPDDIIMDSFPGPLGQVTINLIMNAAIHAFVGRTHGMISVLGRQIDEQTVELVFSDDGIGIPADILHRIFEPFFTTRMGLGGSGLGLTIVHQMVTQVLRGRVSVESKPGEGSRFTLLLAKSIPHPGGSAMPQA